MIRAATGKILQRWLKGTEGLAAVEAAMIFPLLLTLMLGAFDLGNAILINQKAIRASQVTADLVTRGRSVNNTAIEEAIEAGRLAFAPFSTTPFGIDIVSIRFDDKGEGQIVWRETRKMSALDNVIERVTPMAEPGEGIMVVAVEYGYKPVFSGFAVGAIDMQEVAFARGRKSAVVSRN